MEGPRPAMGVERRGLAWRNDGFDDAYGIVFEEESMVGRVRDQRVEMIEPLGWRHDPDFIACGELDRSGVTDSNVKMVG